MSKIALSSVISRVASADWPGAASRLLQDIVTMINGRLEVGANIKGRVLEMTAPTANVDVKLVHRLGYAPDNLVVVKASQAGIVYLSSAAKAATGEFIYPRASVAGSYRVWVF